MPKTKNSHRLILESWVTNVLPGHFTCPQDLARYSIWLTIIADIFRCKKSPQQDFPNLLFFPLLFYRSPFIYFLPVFLFTIFLPVPTPPPLIFHVFLFLSNPIIYPNISPKDDRESDPFSGPTPLLYSTCSFIHWNKVSESIWKRVLSTNNKRAASSDIGF